MNYLFTIGTLLLSAQVSLSQAQTNQAPYTMELRAHRSVSGADYRILIVRGAKSVKLRYFRLDSIRAKLYTDATYRALAATLENKQPAAEREMAARQLVALFDKYKVYRHESLQLRTASNGPFVQLLDSIYQASPAQLKAREANTFHIVLDGTDVQLLVKATGTPDKEVYAQSPGPTSHPELYRLLHQSLELYRQQRPQGFLDTRYTGGY